MSRRREFFISFIPAIFATFALVMSFLANIWCETIKFEPNTGDGDTLQFGVWYYQSWEVVETVTGQIITRDTCIQYPDGVDFDANWKTAKAFSIITPVIGGILVVWNWIAPCLYFGPSFWKKAGIIYILCTLFQGLTLLLLDSNACNNNSILLESSSASLYSSECEFDWGTKVNITSVVFWFVAGVLMLTMKPPQRPERGPAETQTVTYTKSHEPDGAEVVTSDVVKGTWEEKPVGAEA